ncbi:uncharacterized protein LOC129410352 isoform X1 [Boleophthalmus pectinirostris]|uniref:uncharacterized protein LOC129410352 isoform X1 n=1 Tax=Boleophthalmus pectinirostris TaxID=150288 RepID=UPI002430D3DB|nr:uncharacterized protein LOC129410352 isoform X1 [Boleophthalmus pectinirostris]
MSSASLNCRLNLTEITTTGRNVEYNTRINQLIMRIRSPRSTAMISGRGHLSCTGAHSLDDAHAAARRFARIVQKLGFPVTFSKYKVHNVLSVSQTFPVRLDGLHEELRGCSSYEPELFPGLYFHCEKVRICVFHNGKMNFTGSSDLTADTRVFQRLYRLCARPGVTTKYKHRFYY